MSLRALYRLLDQPAFWVPFPGVRVPVRIVDVAPERFGRVDCTVTPMGGVGSMVVSKDKLVMEDNHERVRPNPSSVPGLSGR